MSLNLWDLDKEQEVLKPNEDGKAINIDFINVTPLLQIDFDKNSNNVQSTKKLYKKIDGIEYPVSIPVYSANGIRGTLRRIGLELILKIANKQGENVPKISAKTLNFYASGDDKTVESIQNLTFKEQEKLRELMPLISVFGAGLSTIEGKSAVSELRPTDDNFQYVDDEGNIKVNSIVRRIASVRFDEIMRNSRLSALLNEEDVVEWLSFISDNKVSKKRLKELLVKKSKESGLTEKEEAELKELMNFKDNQTQMINEKEYVVPGIHFRGAIAPKRGMAFTEVEKGLLLASLLELAQTQLGSCKKEGFGVGNWSINYDNMSIEVEANKDYFLGEKNIKINKEAQEAIKVFEDFIVKNKVWEYIDVETLFSKI